MLKEDAARLTGVRPIRPWTLAGRTSATYHALPRTASGSIRTVPHTVAAREKESLEISESRNTRGWDKGLCFASSIPTTKR